MSQTQLRTRTRATVEYEHQAEKLSLEAGCNAHHHGDNDEEGARGVAVQANFITPLDPVIETSDGNRLPSVPVQEAHKINILKARAEGRPHRPKVPRPRGLSRFDVRNVEENDVNREELLRDDRESETSRLDEALPPSHTHPLFPPLPLYGPPTFLRNLQCLTFRFTSFFLSTGFLLVVVLGALFTTIPRLLKSLWLRLTFREHHAKRPFVEEEKRRADIRREQDRDWVARKRRRISENRPREDSLYQEKERYAPLEGGPDKLVCDIRYYARRVGLDAEEFRVQTEDGFILTLWHLYDPNEYKPSPDGHRRPKSPKIFPEENSFHQHVQTQFKDGERRYPVLLIHGLLQSAGAYCANDDDSLAFLLCKSGYDVWLGNNRCGFEPEHSLLQYKDPRMWAWNIRQMGVMDLPALISRVLEESGFEKLGLVCHSQGTTETFVALAKEQRPDIGDKISVFCALAPAVYAGPLIDKMYLKFMRVISPRMFRMFFGIHSFIPLMMTMHRILPGRIYGFMGYLVFSFLFNWSDTRWDRGIRDRLFQFSPVYVSAESMRWWLGRECFTKQRCILATRELGQQEDVEDQSEEERREDAMSKEADRGRTAWYDDHVPPFALWVAGSDDLVDGRRLLRRFERGREPHVNVVHSKVIEEYEHLDVLWAIDAVEQVGQEVRQLLWKTMPEDARGTCRKILGVNENSLVGDGQASEQ
ncbi:uncharacterized protein PV06_01230 [Exophiala oligosperma]|uniref:Partial AB-hydrolase lipase domain-containing protein n=1 Tax=Exophiala oligosperma TaxID=215243 RepID=A0A0D2B8Y1_9EURO|nr:uncharacterized protein PV06_01230 [Exophiala oligosperma]KIW48661.1 hypothetical protein PV06_01230 [Exophiala oligosperma]